MNITNSITSKICMLCTPLQEAQLLQRDHAMLRAIKYFDKSKRHT